MHRSHWGILIGSSVFLAAVVITAAQQPAAKPSAAPAAKPAAQAPAGKPAPAPAAGFAPVASLKDLMDAVVDPTSKILFNAVSVESTKEGLKTNAPKNAEEWAVVRRNALMLAEAGNLLKMPGRRAELPGNTSTPTPENLLPAQIDALIAQDRAAFNKAAQALTDAALVALKAIDAKNADGVSDAGETLDSACESCHVKYWYPPKK